MTAEPQIPEPTPEVGHDEEAGHSSNAHLIFNEGIIVVLAMIIIYIAFEAFKHKYNISFGHEASLVTLIGFGISYAFIKEKEFGDLMSFNDDLFFYFCLPPIVFASGFNMQRKKFFENFGNIMLFGLVGTFICFISFSGLTILYTEVLTDNMT